MTAAWAVAATTPALEARAADWAERAGRPLVPATDRSHPYLLRLTPEGLELCTTAPGGPGALRVDFTGGAMRHRLRTMGRRSLLGRALGFHRRPPKTVVDATAGLGQDGFVLAALGGRVVMVERLLPFFLLLEDGLARARSHPHTAEIATRIRLVHADARHWLAGCRAEAVHLDPMYPERRGRALSGKGMQLARTLAGEDEDAGELLAVARIAAPRVAVKRPHRAGPLAGVQPDGAIQGRKTRYDLYLK